MSKHVSTQVSSAVDYKNLSQSILYYLQMQKPEVKSAWMQQLYKNDPSMQMVNWINGFPTEEVEQENGFFYWDLMGKTEKNIPLVDAETLAGLTISGSTFPLSIGSGLPRERFYLVFEEEIFHKTDVIRTTDNYHFLIVDKIEAGNSRYKFLVELVNDDPDIACPIDELVINSRWVKTGNMQPSDLSFQGTQGSFTSAFRMMQTLGKYRAEYEVTGAMIEKGKNEPLELPIIGLDNTKYKTWINAVEMNTYKELQKVMARSCLHGKKNWNTAGQFFNYDDTVKFEVKQGSGFYEQIAPGNKHFYNTFDLDYLTDIALSMYVNRESRTNRNITLVTGEYGAMEFSKAVQTKVGNQITVSNLSPFGGPTSAGANVGTGNRLEYGSQYVKYVTVNGITFEVFIADWFDDTVFYPSLHPQGLGTQESHRMLIMPSGADSGIVKLKPKGRGLEYGVIPGLRNPFTPGGKGLSAPGMIASGVEGYKGHFLDWGGLVMKNPTLIHDLQLNV